LKKSKKNIKINVLFDYQAFYNQTNGGISRSMSILIEELKKKKKVKISSCILFTFNQHINNEFSINSMLVKKFVNITNLLKTNGRLISRYWINLRLLYFRPDIFIPTYYDYFFKNSIGNTPFVITIHDMIHELQFFDDEYSKKIIDQKKKLIFASKAIIAISNNTKKDILSFYPSIPEDKINVIYWGNPMARYKNMTLGIQKKKQLLFVGKREGYKNFSWLVIAVSDWLKKNDFNLLCVGGNSFSSTELADFNRLDLSDRIFQKNHTDQELANAYTESFALLVPSLYEGFCFPVIEAMSLRCPVIYSDNSCLPEVASFAGLSFGFDNRDQICDLLLLLLDNDFYEKQVEYGLNRSNEFSWTTCSEETFRVFKNCIN
jgi:glycosyltransferase involved in cell wall biosynthesis